jgi:hypothetical protein
MSSPDKARLAVAVVWEWVDGHRFAVLWLLLALVVAGQQAGLIEPRDWGGTGEEIR